MTFFSGRLAFVVVVVVVVGGGGGGGGGVIVSSNSWNLSPQEMFSFSTFVKYSLWPYSLLKGSL